MNFDWLFKRKKNNRIEPVYWIGYVKYNYLQTVDCHGNDVKQPMSVPTERQFSLYAVNEEAAMDQLYDMFTRAYQTWTTNPLDYEVQPEFAVRRAKKEELDRMI